MDEYLSEKEQIEQIKQWWHDYGWYLVGGAAVSALGYFGWNQYNEYRDDIGERAAALYGDLALAIDEDRGSIDDILAELRSEYAGSPYADQGRLLAARHYLVRDTDRAAEELRSVMETSDDDELAMVARLRLARVEAYRENFEAALAVLDVDEPGAFEARIAEIRGDVHAARGQVEPAREAYIRALTAPGSDLLDRSFVQMKLNDLRADAAPAPAAEAPTGSVVEPSDEAPAEPSEGAATEPSEGAPAEAPAQAEPAIEAPADPSAAEAQPEAVE